MDECMHAAGMRQSKCQLRAVMEVEELIWETVGVNMQLRVQWAGGFGIVGRTMNTGSCMGANESYYSNWSGSSRAPCRSPHSARLPKGALIDFHGTCGFVISALSYALMHLRRFDESKHCCTSIRSILTRFAPYNPGRFLWPTRSSTDCFAFWKSENQRVCNFQFCFDT